jgi:hypothetical protein
MQAANRAREWWKDNRATFMASVETTLNIVEKALNGMPIYGPQAAVSAAAATLKAFRVRPSLN